MKTVKLLKKMNVVFLALILLMGLANWAFGQSPQSYGDSSLVKIEATYYMDSAAIQYFPDRNLVSATTIWINKQGVREVDVQKKFKKRGIAYLVYFEDDCQVLFKTKTGTTSVVFVRGAGKDGFLLVNGKMAYTFDGRYIYEWENGSRDEDYFKDKIAWASEDFIK